MRLEERSQLIMPFTWQDMGQIDKVAQQRHQHMPGTSYENQRRGVAGELAVGKACGLTIDENLYENRRDFGDLKLPCKCAIDVKTTAIGQNLVLPGNAEERTGVCAYALVWWPLEEHGEEAAAVVGFLMRETLGDCDASGVKLGAVVQAPGSPLHEAGCDVRAWQSLRNGWPIGMHVQRHCESLLSFMQRTNMAYRYAVMFGGHYGRGTWR